MHNKDWTRRIIIIIIVYKDLSDKFFLCPKTENILVKQKQPCQFGYFPSVCLGEHLDLRDCKSYDYQTC